MTRSFGFGKAGFCCPRFLLRLDIRTDFFVEEFGGGFSFQLSFVVVVFELNLLDMSYGLKRSCRAQWALLDLLRLDDDATKEG